jgi:ribosomal protein S18 acetylase RimI-like enzyme
LANVRRAELFDANRLAALAAATFKDAFGAANRPENIDAYCRTRYGEAIQATEIANPSMVTLLCEQRGTLAGFAQLRWGQAPGCVIAAAPGEIQRLYVMREFHGTGVAHELMNRCIDEMAARQSDVMWLGVWERNFRAAAFYRKFGFIEVGEHVFPLGTERQRDVVMARPVVELRSST